MSPKQKSWRSKAPGLNEQFKVIKLDTFHYTVRVIVTDSIEGSHKYREHIFEPIDLSNAEACHAPTSDAISYIILPYDCEAWALAHEVSHAVWSIFECIGAKPENEIQAYLTGHLVHQATLFMMKAAKIRTKHEPEPSKPTTLPEPSKPTTLPDPVDAAN